MKTKLTTLLLSLMLLTTSTTVFSQLGLTEKQIRKQVLFDITMNECNDTAYYIGTMQTQGDGVKMVIVYSFNDKDVCDQILIKPRSQYQSKAMEKRYKLFLLKKDTLNYVMVKSTAPMSGYIFYVFSPKDSSFVGPIDINE